MHVCVCPSIHYCKDCAAASPSCLPDLLLLLFFCPSALWHLLKIFWFPIFFFVVATGLLLLLWLPHPWDHSRTYHSRPLQGAAGLLVGRRSQAAAFVYLSFRSVSNSKSFWLNTYYAATLPHALRCLRAIARSAPLDMHPLCNVWLLQLQLTPLFVKCIV